MLNIKADGYYSPSIQLIRLMEANKLCVCKIYFTMVSKYNSHTYKICDHAWALEINAKKYFLT